VPDQRFRPLLRTTLGDVLRRTRLGQGRTLADVARAARISMQYLSELERGRKEASSEILAAICDALSVDLPDVLAEVGRDLAGAGAQQQAIVLRLGTGPDRLAQSAPFRSNDVVSLLAA
jgi:transcriptional regulator with XRE-family HTH domain